VAAVVAVAMLVAGCGDGDADSVRGDEPPWGLTGIEMPDTEADVIAVLQALPAIDGHQPGFGIDEDYGFPIVIYSESDDGEGLWISASPEPDPLGVFPEAWNIEPSTADPESDLLWTTPPFADEEGFGFIWASSDGSWVFYLSADTAESRIELIDAFVSAAGG
jgi:hypothetical protein